MTLSLPQHDGAPTERQNQLDADRAVWKFDPTQLGLPLAGRDKPEGPSALFMQQAGVSRAMLTKAREGANASPLLAAENAAVAAYQGVADEKPRQPGGCVRSRMVQVSAVEHFQGLFDGVGLPATAGHADDDAFFAWQRLAGPNAAHLRQQRSWDPRFAVTDAHLRAASVMGDSIDRARAEGRLYVLDLTAVHGLEQGETLGHKRYSDGVLAMFLSTVTGEFRPVAIQPSPLAGTPIFTPRDGHNWRQAKLSTQVADAIWSGSVVHLGFCHAVAAAVQVCAGRELAPNHPVRHLLWPHFELTEFANQIMKVNVIGPGGYFDELMAPTRESAIQLAVRALRSRSLRDCAPWREIALRGCDSTSALPVYPYRDDALPVGWALRRWVDGYLRCFYHDNESLHRDPEIQAWQRALGAADGGGLHDVPSMQTVDELVDLVTTIIFIISVYHAVVNYGGFDHFAWPTTYPTARWAPFDPHRENTEADYLQALAPYAVAQRMLDLTVPQRELKVNRLGRYPDGYFDDPRVLEHLAALQRELDAIEKVTAARDASRPYSFPYLLPSKMALSIHV